MVNDDIISMPDKWEYPWYSAWDLAFHTVTLASVDIDFAKRQLDLMLKQRYLHPNGQIPAYEWNFSDVNPPVHAWATLAAHRTEQAVRGEGDLRFLKRSFGKLLANFTWWVNRKDRFGKNVFEGGFFYDVLRLPDGRAARLKVRSMVGLLPLCATSVTEPWQRERVPGVLKQFEARIRRMPELLGDMYSGQGYADRGLMALVNPDRLRRILSCMLDENEFLSPHGIRALSRYHLEHPYVLNVRGKEYRVNYLPADSDSGMFGGNSNWRGPVWMPVNMLLIRALLSFYAFYGDSFKVECPTGSGREMNLFEVAREIANRLISIFVRDANGRRPVFGGLEKFQTDPHWRDHILFHEYFHGDNGAGIGASHQTGWSGLVATLIELFRSLDAGQLLEVGRKAVFAREWVAPNLPKQKITE
jgi:hypothetical protein